jgi:glycosyltransferase involved in cell wall biosynthesis
VRVLVFHGYLLSGTGSNVYNANLAAALARMGHEVHLLAQERRPEELAFVDAAGDWDGGRLAVRALRERNRAEGGGRCTVYRPDIAGLLPVYVADRYEGIEARPFPELGDEELDRYLERNVAAVREVAAEVDPDLALANHLVMGPVILARALAGLDVPYAVKVHGSALEYTVKPHPRFLPHAREGLAGARCVLVGSRHTAESLWAAMEDPGLPDRTRLGPPGVDVHAFGPREPAGVARGLDRLAGRLDPAGDGGRPSARGGEQPATSFTRDEVAAARVVRSLDPGTERLVAFVGKLIVSKGVDLLVAAWPLVLQRVPGARLVVVGFGAYRAGLERLAGALARGDLEDARALAAEGRAAEGGPRSRLAHLDAFLAGLEGPASANYRRTARRLPEQLAFAGRLDHEELADLLPAFEALVVPSTFPEAFGMVAAEAAACGVLPLSARHSGLAEVSEALAAAVPPETRPWLSFDVGPGAVRDIAAALVAWLEAPADLRARTRAALVAVAAERYSWEGVARGVIAAGRGELGSLAPPPATEPSGG